MYKRTDFITSALIILLVIFFAWLIAAPEATPVTMEKRLNRIDQDPAHYLSPNQPAITLTPDQQAHLLQMFLTLYFSPWDDDARSAASTAAVLLSIQQEQQAYSQQPGWQFTGFMFSAEGIQTIIANVDLTNYPAINLPGIVVHVSQVRTFPTLLPSYGNPQAAGEGYPFDNWIGSYVFPATPVRILQQSKDRLWYLIKTASYYGWVQSSAIGFVSADFITQWKSHAWVVAVRDDTPVFYDNHRRAVLSLRKGLIYPALGDQGQQLQILMPFLSANGDAQIQTLLVDKSNVRSFPMPATAETIAVLARNFIGQQYGWGGLYELRDCSATTSDLFANFGFWLPRNSSQQSHFGRIVSLANMNRNQKLDTIIREGVPFFTLIHFPGHIAVYLGAHDHQVYILQDVWGLRTENFWGREGRAVFGKTIITPIDFGKNFSNIPILQLDRADSLSILSPDFYTPENINQIDLWK